MRAQFERSAKCIGKKMYQGRDQETVSIQYCFTITNHPEPLQIGIAVSAYKPRIKINPEEYIIAIIFGDDVPTHVRTQIEIQSEKSKLGSDWPVFDGSFIRHLVRYNLTPDDYKRIVSRALLQIAMMQGAADRQSVEDAMRYLGSSKSIRCT